MNRVKNIIAIAAFSLLMLALPAIASAQYGGNGGWNNGGYNNGQYGNNGYYGDIRSTLRDLKDRSKDFKKQIDHQKNNGFGGIFGGYNPQNDRYLKDLADQFKKAADRLEDQYHNGRDQYRSQDEAQQVLNLGSQLQQALQRSRSNGYLQSQWSQIRNDLNVVANTYGYNNGGYNNNNRNGGWNNNGNWNKPNWWPF